MSNTRKTSTRKTSAYDQALDDMRDVLCDWLDADPDDHGATFYLGVNAARNGDRIDHTPRATFDLAAVSINLSDDDKKRVLALVGQLWPGQAPPADE